MVFTNRLKEYIRANLAVCLVTLVIFGAGIITGSLGINTLSVQQQEELQDYVDLVLQGTGDWQVDSTGLAQRVIWSNIKVVALIWFLGLTVIGIPLILGVIFLRGLVLGFTISFLIQEKAAAGILLTLFSILPQNLFLLPALLLAAVSAVTFSLNLVRGRFSHGLQLPRYFVGYTLLFCGAAAFVITGGLVEAFLSPAFIKLIAVYF